MVFDLLCLLDIGIRHLDFLLHRVPAGHLGFYFRLELRGLGLVIADLRLGASPGAALFEQMCGNALLSYSEENNGEVREDSEGIEALT